LSLSEVLQSPGPLASESSSLVPPADVPSTSWVLAPVPTLTAPSTIGSRLPRGPPWAASVCRPGLSLSVSIERQPVAPRLNQLFLTP